MGLSLLQTQMPDVTIPNGTADAIINWGVDYFDAEAITVFAPGTLPETITWQGSVDGVTYYPVQDVTATAVKLPTAGSVISYNGIFTGYNFLKLHSGVNVAADRVFRFIKSWRGF